MWAFELALIFKLQSLFRHELLWRKIISLVLRLCGSRMMIDRRMNLIHNATAWWSIQSGVGHWREANLNGKFQIRGLDINDSMDSLTFKQLATLRK